MAVSLPSDENKIIVSYFFNIKIYLADQANTDINVALI